MASKLLSELSKLNEEQKKLFFSEIKENEYEFTCKHEDYLNKCINKSFMYIFKTPENYPKYTIDSLKYTKGVQFIDIGDYGERFEFLTDYQKKELVDKFINKINDVKLEVTKDYNLLTFKVNDIYFEFKGRHSSSMISSYACANMFVYDEIEKIAILPKKRRYYEKEKITLMCFSGMQGSLFLSSESNVLKHFKTLNLNYVNIKLFSNFLTFCKSSFFTFTPMYNAIHSVHYKMSNIKIARMLCSCDNYKKKYANKRIYS